MIERACIVEGPDDLAVLREYVRTLGHDHRPIKGAPREFEVVASGWRTRFLNAQGKEKLAQRSLDAATASQRPENLVVCFDPDGKDTQHEFEFFLDGLRAEECHVTINSGHVTATTKRKQRLVIQPAPWRSATEESFDGLDATRNLERILISGILTGCRSEPDCEVLLAAATKATEVIHSAIPKHDWKRAFRIFGAAIKPDAESFAEGLMQHSTFGKHARRAVEQSEAGRVIRELLST